MLLLVYLVLEYIVLDTVQIIILQKHFHRMVKLLWVLIELLKREKIENNDIVK